MSVQRGARSRDHPDKMTSAVTPRSSSLVLGIALFVVLGTPLVAYLWETLNQLLAGIVDPMRLLITVPAALIFYFLLRFMARSVETWSRERGAPSDGGA